MNNSSCRITWAPPSTMSWALTSCGRVNSSLLMLCLARRDARPSPSDGRLIGRKRSETGKHLNHNIYFGCESPKDIATCIFKANQLSSTAFDPSPTSTIVLTLARRVPTIGGWVRIRDCTSIIEPIFHYISFARAVIG